MPDKEMESVTKEGSRLELKTKEWWRFYFRKSFWSILTVPFFLILIYQALYTSWESLRFLIALGKYSWTTILVFAVIMIPLGILFTINYLSYTGIILIPTLMYEHSEWKKWKKILSYIGLYLVLLFIPWWSLMIFETAVIHLVG